VTSSTALHMKCVHRVVRGNDDPTGEKLNMRQIMRAADDSPEFAESQPSVTLS